MVSWSATVCWVFFDLQHNSVSHFNQKATGIPQDVCFYPYLLSVIYYLFCTQICVYRVGYESRLILKYQDDSVIVSQLQDNEPNRGTVLDDFVKSNMWSLALEHVLIHKRLHPLRGRRWNVFSLMNVLEQLLIQTLKQTVKLCGDKRASAAVMFKENFSFPLW